MENINPTRMELLRFKEKLKAAEKGHKLLKEKVLELIRNYYVLIKKLKELRIFVEREQKQIFQDFFDAKTRLSKEEIALLFAMPNHIFSLNFCEEDIFNIKTPKIEITENILDKNLPYSPLSSTGQIDSAVANFYELFPKIVKLAELEKKVFLLSDEIEKGKRRVNGLENVVIPKYKQNIKQIETKLSENERETTSRLMKVKDMISKD